MAKKKNDKKQPITIGDKRQPNGTFGPNNMANPNGRPKGSISIVQLIKRKAEQVPEGQRLSFAEAMVESLFKKAVRDEDLNAMKEIINRIDGMPKQQLDVKQENVFEELTPEEKKKIDEYLNYNEPFSNGNKRSKYEIS